MNNPVFLAGPDIRAQILRRLKKTKKFDAAVAFWGKGAAGQFPDHLKTGKVRIICNLLSGGTNPYEIEKLRDCGFQIKHRDDLHAKVYLFDDDAIMGSANFSANGLGLEGKEQSGWLEAGALLDDAAAQAARDWFEALWKDKQTKKLKQADLKQAVALWGARQRQKPTIKSILDFDFDQDDDKLPYISWYGNDKWSESKKAIQEHFGAVSRQRYKQIVDQIEDGIELEDEQDLSVLHPGRWVLDFELASYRKGKGIALYWIHLGDLIRGAYFYDDAPEEFMDCFLADANPPPPPFEINNPLLRLVVSQTLQKIKYRKLVQSRYDGPWFKPRLHLFQPFWKDVQNRYRELTAK